MAEMPDARYLCSQLVTIAWKDGETARNTVVNLDEIWVGGCVVESEVVIQPGSVVELLCGTADFAGEIKTAKGHAFGCRIEVEFLEGTAWDLAAFRPEHLFDPEALKTTESP